MIDVFIADYRNPLQLDAVVSLLDSYARDPAGGGTPLAEDIKQNLPAALAGRPQMFSVLAFDGGEPIGLVNCIEGFSTFACKPLVNVHDVVVLESHRGQHIVQRMFACVEVEARARGACKLTLEVLSNNEPALRAYARQGFAAFQLDPSFGTALFLQKKM